MHPRPVDILEANRLRQVELRLQPFERNHLTIGGLRDGIARYDEAGDRLSRIHHHPNGAADVERLARVFQSELKHGGLLL